MEKKKTSDSKYYLYEKIVNESYDALCVTDGEGRFVIANKATADSMGLSEDEIIGATPQDLIDKSIYGSSTILEAIKTKQTVTGLVTVRGTPCMSTSVHWYDEEAQRHLILTNNCSYNNM